MLAFVFINANELAMRFLWIILSFKSIVYRVSLAFIYRLLLLYET